MNLKGEDWIGCYPTNSSFYHSFPHTSNHGKTWNSHHQLHFRGGGFVVVPQTDESKTNLKGEDWIGCYPSNTTSTHSHGHIKFSIIFTFQGWWFLPKFQSNCSRTANRWEWHEPEGIRCYPKQNPATSSLFSPIHKWLVGKLGMNLLIFHFVPKILVAKQHPTSYKESSCVWD